MAWSGSAMFTYYVASCIQRNQNRNIWSDAMQASFRFALYDNTVTPNRLAPLNSHGYQQGEWIAAREVTGPGVPAGGLPAPGWTIEKAPGGAFALLASQVNAYAVTLPRACFGNLMYSAIAAGGDARGVAFHYYGGPVSVNGGQLTLTWGWPPGTICLGSP